MQDLLALEQKFRRNDQNDNNCIFQVDKFNRITDPNVTISMRSLITDREETEVNFKSQRQVDADSMYDHFGFI